MAQPHGLEFWGCPVDPSGLLSQWAQATAERNAQSLEDGQGPGGKPLAPLKPSTIKRRKGDPRPGFGETKAMAQGLAAPGVVKRRSKTFYQVRGAPPGSTAEDEVNFFVTGQKNVKAQVIRDTRKIAKEAGVKASSLLGRLRKVTAPRDIFGHDEAIVEEYASKLLDDIAGQLGFA